MERVKFCASHATNNGGCRQQIFRILLSRFAQRLALFCNVLEASKHPKLRKGTEQPGNWKGKAQFGLRVRATTSAQHPRFYNSQLIGGMKTYNGARGRFTCSAAGVEYSTGSCLYVSV